MQEGDKASSFLYNSKCKELARVILLYEFYFLAIIIA